MLFNGQLFRHRATLRQMLDLARAQGEGGLAGYGLRIEQYALPGGVDLIGHLGGTAGYRSCVGRLRPLGITMAFALNAQDDPTPLVIPAVQALAATHRVGRGRRREAEPWSRAARARSQTTPPARLWVPTR